MQKVTKADTLTVVDVNYTDSKGVESTRSIIPINVPTENISAIDVSSLSEEERADVLKAYEEYSTYYKNFTNGAFSFAEFHEHQAGGEVVSSPGGKWRSFKADKLLKVDNEEKDLQ